MSEAPRPTKPIPGGHWFGETRLAVMIITRDADTVVPQSADTCCVYRVSVLGQHAIDMLVVLSSPLQCEEDWTTVDQLAARCRARGFSPSFNQGHSMSHSDLMNQKELQRLRLRCGQVVRIVREASGLTQETAAAAIGVSQSVLSKIEAGHRRLEVAEYVALCRAMQAEPDNVMRQILNRG